VCAIAYFLEAEGIMTTGISLVRENAEALQPPRTLWVPFPLGRPLGTPNDVEFQQRVISAALDLLNREHGPVLEDFPEDIDASQFGPLSCPVSFKQTEPQTDAWPERLRREIAELKPWYDEGARRRRRTTVGVSPLDMQANADFVGQAVHARGFSKEDIVTLKLAVEDLKAFYSEALTARPGPHDADAVMKILWYDTFLGEALHELHEICRNDESLKLLTLFLLPRSVQHDD